MTTSLAFSANEFGAWTRPAPSPSVIRWHICEPAVRRHFGPDTGSRYWPTPAKTLGIGPLTDTVPPAASASVERHHCAERYLR